MPLLSGEEPSLFQCSCDGGENPKTVDSFGYHMVGWQIEANAIRLYDEVAFPLAKLSTSLCVDAIVEPLRLFANAGSRGNSQRPGIFLRNQEALGGQVIDRGNLD